MVIGFGRSYRVLKPFVWHDYTKHRSRMHRYWPKGLEEPKINLVAGYQIYLPATNLRLAIEKVKLFLQGTPLG